MVILGGLICLMFSLQAQESQEWDLERCIEYALEQNLSVRKNILANQSLENAAAQARAQVNPSLNGSVSQNFSFGRTDGLFSGSGDLTSTTSNNYSVSAGMTLFNASRITNQIRQSALNVEGGRYNLETMKETISLSILNAYLQVLYAEEQVKNSSRQIESTAEKLNLAGERLALQIISKADYAQVKSQLASEKLNLANAQSQLAIAKVNLMQLMELPVNGDFSIAHPDLGEQINQYRSPDVTSIFDRALAIKPQIRYAAVNKEIAALDEKIAKAGLYPNLSASAGISTGYSSRSDSPYFDQLDQGLNPSVGLSLSIPIYQKRQVKTSIESARIGYQNAELSEADTRNQLRKNIEQACQDVVSAQQEYEASLESYHANLESESLSNEKFRQGIINSVDYLVSKTNLIVAESKLLQSKYNLIFSYKILDFYAGIPLTL